MRRSITYVAVAAALGVAMISGGGLANALPDERATSRSYAHLTGAAERPGPGDPDASGIAHIFIYDNSNTLCVILGFQNVDGTLSGFHIHFAPPTSPGPIVVPFSVPTGPRFEQCVVVANEALLDNIAANPHQYYINLHSQPNFGPGAIRGQLTNAT